MAIEEPEWMARARSLAETYLPEALLTAGNLQTIWNEIREAGRRCGTVELSVREAVLLLSATLRHV